MIRRARPRGATARDALFAAVTAILLAAGHPGIAGRATAAPADPAWPMIAQADTSGFQADSTDDAEDDEEEVPIPPNLLEPGPGPTALPDTTGAPAVRSDSTAAPGDSTGARVDSLGSVVPNVPAEPETLRYVPPGSKPPATVKPSTTGAAPAAIPERKSRGLLGLTPAVVILGLAVIHFLVLRTVD